MADADRRGAPPLDGPGQPVPRTLADHLAKYALLTPDAPAIQHGDAVLTYAELDEQATQLAIRLRDLGVAHRARVAVEIPRSIDHFVALLAIFRAGGTHVPIDPDQPAERRQSIVEAAQVHVLIGRGLSIERLSAFAAAAPDTRDLAYVIHTSGSTGTPKGVMVSHEAFLHHLTRVRDAYGCSSGDRILMLAGPVFDVSLEQVGLAVLSGATLVLPDADFWMPQEIPDKIAELGITVVDISPAYLRETLAHVERRDPRLRTLRLLNIGNDVIRYGDLQEWFAKDVPADVICCYGPTEGTITATVYPVTPAMAEGKNPSASVPIGSPLPGTRVHVLDEQLHPVEDGAVGELFISGPRVAAGYLNRAEETAARFLHDPFAGDSGTRMYRTGDMVRRRSDGGLEFHGRRDGQVKIRGFRVELGEVEHALRTHPGVRAAHAQAEKDRDEVAITAYVVGEVDVRELAEDLRKRLPDHMVPAKWATLDALPFTPGGKVDRAALPAAGPIVADPKGARSFSRTEAELSDIWESLLGTAPATGTDDFFDLGGDSLKIARLSARIGTVFGVRVPLRQLMEHSSLSDLTELVEDLVRRDSARPAAKETFKTRSAAFDVTVSVSDPKFLGTPIGHRRTWTLERSLSEFQSDLEHLDRLVASQTRGVDRPVINGSWDRSGARYTPSQLVIEGQEVMQDWERPLMRAMAAHVTESRGHVLEVGFGMGISATFIQEFGAASHTVIEPNEDVIVAFERWREGYPDRDIRLVRGFWDEAIDRLAQFDAIFFDTYPTNEREYRDTVVHSTNYAESFFEAAAAHLRTGGVFSYYTNEIDTVGRSHQRSLLRHFSSFSVEVVRDLAPPSDCTYWWADSMVAVKAVK
ncbi:MULTISPECIES: amino acid adenylation domain-containing protein [unclassified Streptomyces]|uniref:amino acid adenylation domain-containing protein n=1 Tax=unclassified Streptomyces TaxID=2593676 RepID=UPI002251AB89|nr:MULTISPECIES: amino acid adenylation domain-containing protein [unclassified Streptomyces]